MIPAETKFLPGLHISRDVLWAKADKSPMGHHSLISLVEVRSGAEYVFKIEEVNSLERLVAKVEYVTTEAVELEESRAIIKRPKIDVVEESLKK